MRKPLVELAETAYRRGYGAGTAVPMVFLSALLAISYAVSGDTVWAVVQWFFFVFFLRHGWKAWKAHRDGLRILKGEEK